MTGKWNVEWNGRKVGTCTVEQQGLYRRFVCRCGKTAQGICRLVMKCGDYTLDLGILVPVDGGFGLEKRIPVKNLPAGEPEFMVAPQDCGRLPEFIPVRIGEPFAYLDRLREARFALRNGEPGILLDSESKMSNGLTSRTV